MIRVLSIDGSPDDRDFVSDLLRSSPQAYEVPSVVDSNEVFDHLDHQVVEDNSIGIEPKYLKSIFTTLKRLWSAGQYKGEHAMTNADDRIVREARRTADKRAAGYRALALRMYPWVCGSCARSFTHVNLQLLEVHHKNGNHHDNPSDGSNWELLCTYCHEHEHSKLKDSAGRAGRASGSAPSTFNPFADLKAVIKARRGENDPQE
ncbi:MAG: YajD family HNH nuclease [Burkholderiaceae bacterium]